MRLTLRTRINLALVAGVVLVITFGVAAYVTIGTFLDEAQGERASHEDMLLVERMVTQLKTAESWQRKYVITADTDDLKAYQDAMVHVTHALARLRGIGHTPADRARMARLEDAVRRRLAGMEQTVQARLRAGLAAAGARVGSDAARELQGDIDRLVEQAKAAEAAAILASRSQTEANARIASGLILAGVVLAAMLLAWAAYLVNLYAAHRRRAESSLAGSVVQLERATAALRASEGQLRDVLDTVPVLFTYVDDQQRMRFHNLAYAQSLGLPSRDIEGKTLREILGATTYEHVRPYIDLALAGEFVTYERSQRHLDGRLRDYEMNYFPHFEGGGAGGKVIGVYAMGSDVTEFKRIDRMKSDFVSTVSHELRTPLTSIRGSLGLIAGGIAGPLPDKAKTLVEIARDNCERLVRLVSDILDIDKIESGKMVLQMQPARLEPLLARAIAGNEGFAAQHQVTLELDAADAQLGASVDTDRIMQVLTNLLSNAVKFSPPGSHVTVRLLQDSELVRIEVQDQGPGVPQEFRDRIFSRFSQADSSDTRQKGGTGLGLSISRAIVEMMGGQIGFRNRHEGGSTFFVELPLVAVEAADNAVT